MAGVVDQLIDAVVFQQLATYEAGLKACSDATEKFVVETGKLVTGLDKLKDTMDIQQAFQELVNIEKEANAVEQTRTQTISKLEQEQKRLTDMEAKRVTATKTANTTVTESIKATEKLSRSVDMTIKEYEELAAVYMESEEAQAENAKLTEKAEEVTRRLIHSYSDEARELAAVQEAMRQRNVELRREVRENMTGLDSVKSLGVQLTQLQAEYENLSAVERESTGGRAMQQQIAELSVRYKGLRAEMGQFQANVGDYEGAIKRAIGVNDGLKGSIVSLFVNSEKMGKVQEQTAKAMAGASTGFQRAGVAVKGFGKQLWALASNPVIAILAALVAVFKIFQSAINSSRKNSESFSRAMAPLKAVLSLVKAALQAVVGVVLKAIEAFSNIGRAVMKLAERLPIVGKLFKAVNDRMEEGLAIEKDKQRLDEMARNATVEDAKAAYEVAELRNKIAQKDKYTAEERLAMNQQAIKIEGERMAAELERAELAFSIAKRESALAQNSLEEDNALAEAEAKLYEVRSKFAEGTIRLEKQAAQLREELRKEELDNMKNLSAVTVQVLTGQANMYKAVADDEKLSLSERLKANEDYVKRRAAILREQARVSMAETDDPNKTRLIQIKLQQDLEAVKLESEKFVAEQTIAIRRRVEEATIKVIETRRSVEQAALLRTVDDESAALDKRVEAYRAYADSRIAALQEAAERERAKLIGDAEAVAAERLAIQEKLDAEILAIRQESTDKVLAMEETATQKLIEQINTRAAAAREALSLDESKELSALSGQYAKGLMSKEQYERAKEEITIKYATRSAQIELDMLRESLTTFVGTQEEKNKLIAAINEAEIKLEKDKLDAILALNEAAGDKLSAGREKRLKELKTGIQSTLSSVAESFATIYTQQSEKRQQEYDAELERVKGQMDAEQARLEASEMSDERRAAKQAALDAQRAQQEAEIEAKKREEELRQARFEKNWATAQAIMNTALAIGKAASSAPWPINLPLIAFAAATGAAQLAAIRNAPLPKYALGGKNLPEGLALVGDAFRHEVYESPRGGVSITPDTPTVAYVERGANIYKDIPTYLQSQFREMQGTARDMQQPYLSSREIVGELKALRKDVRSQTGSYLRVDVDAPHIWRVTRGKDARIKSITKSLHV